MVAEPGDHAGVSEPRAARRACPSPAFPTVPLTWDTQAQPPVILSPTFQPLQVSLTIRLDSGSSEVGPVEGGVLQVADGDVSVSVEPGLPGPGEAEGKQWGHWGGGTEERHESRKAWAEGGQAGQWARGVRGGWSLEEEVQEAE